MRHGTSCSPALTDGGRPPAANQSCCGKYEASIDRSCRRSDMPRRRLRQAAGSLRQNSRQGGLAGSLRRRPSQTGFGSPDDYRRDLTDSVRPGLPFPRQRGEPSAKPQAATTSRGSTRITKLLLPTMIFLWSIASVLQLGPPAMQTGALMRGGHRPEPQAVVTDMGCAQRGWKKIMRPRRGHCHAMTFRLWLRHLPPCGACMSHAVVEPTADPPPGVPGRAAPAAELRRPDRLHGRRSGVSPIKPSLGKIQPV